MGVTIFFIFISIVVILGTTIYVKKNNKFYNYKPEEKANLKKQKRNIKDIWGIEKIKNDLITVQGQHSIIIEIGSIEYRLLNEMEQESIDNTLINISKTMDYKTQFFSTVVKVDTREKSEEIRNNMKMQRNINMVDYGNAIIEYLEDIMQEEDLYVRKNYLIVSCFEVRKKAEYMLKEFYDNLKYGLSNIKVNTKLLTDAGIIELLHREFNKESTENIDEIVKKGGLDFYVKNKEKRKENIT